MKVFLWQFRVLLARNCRLFLADRTGFILTALQPFLIALLIWVALAHGIQDHHQEDANIRELKAVVQKIDDDRENTEVIREKFEFNRLRYGILYLDEVEEEAPDMSVVSASHASARATVFFVMVAAAVWMGLLSSCKEVVSEWAALHRESHSTFSAGAYILSKLVVFGSALLVQAVVLTALTQLPLLGWPGWCEFGGICALNWLTSLCACALGLLISCLIGSIRWALALIPVFMMPQILLGGLLRPPAQVEESQRSFWRTAGAAVTFQRWAFEAELVVDTHWSTAKQNDASEDCRKVAVAKVDKSEKSRLYQPKCNTTVLDRHFFLDAGKTPQNHLWFAVCILLSQLAVMVAATIGFLIVRIRLANQGKRFCA